MPPEGAGPVTAAGDEATGPPEAAPEPDPAMAAAPAHPSDSEAEPEPEPEPASETEPDVAAGPRWAVVMVFEIAIDLPTPHALVTLREVDEPHRLFVIPMGMPEATALAYAWRGVATPRPLIHELMTDVLLRLGATLEVVRLMGRREGMVLAELELSSARGFEHVTCRSSDGITLSVRQGVRAPILLDERLFDAQGDVEPLG